MLPYTGRASSFASQKTSWPLLLLRCMATPDFPASNASECAPSAVPPAASSVLELVMLTTVWLGGLCLDGVWPKSTGAEWQAKCHQTEQLGTEGVPWTYTRDSTMAQDRNGWCVPFLKAAADLLMRQCLQLLTDPPHDWAQTASWQPCSISNLASLGAACKKACIRSPGHYTLRSPAALHHKVSQGTAPQGLPGHCIKRSPRALHQKVSKTTTPQGLQGHYTTRSPRALHHKASKGTTPWPQAQAATTVRHTDQRKQKPA